MNMTLEIKHEAVWHDEVIDETHLMADPNDVAHVKIEHNITSILVPKVEEQISECESVIEKDTGVGTAPVNVRSGITEEDIRTEVVPNEEQGEEEDDDDDDDDCDVDDCDVDEGGGDDDNDDKDDDEQKEISLDEIYASLQMGINHTIDQDEDAASPKRFPKVLSAADGICVTAEFRNYTRKCSKNLGSQVKAPSHQHYDSSLHSQFPYNTYLSKAPVNKIRRWVCPLCDKVFIQRNNLQQHMETHPAWMGHSCELCEKGLSEMSSLNVRLSPHLREEVSHACNLCSKVCKSSSGLKQHMCVHIQSYTCDICCRLFSSKSDLAFHLKSHALVEEKRKSSRLKSKS